MGTRSLTFVVDEAFGRNEKIVCMYRQFDGYPSGHGIELYDFMKEITITNGIRSAKNKKIANGAGCFAAQMIAHFKRSVGGFYINSIDDDGSSVDYVYTIFVSSEKQIEIEVRESDQEVIFPRGSLGDFKDFCEEEG